MIEGESEENHMLSRKKRGRDSAESVDQAHGWLFESTHWLQMVEVRQRAKTCKSDVLLIFPWLASCDFLGIKQKKNPKNCSGKRAIRNRHWLANPSGGTGERPRLAGPRAGLRSILSGKRGAYQECLTANPRAFFGWKGNRVSSLTRTHARTQTHRLLEAQTRRCQTYMRLKIWSKAQMPRTAHPDFKTSVLNYKLPVPQTTVQF